MRKQASGDRLSHVRQFLFPIAVVLLLLCGPGRTSGRAQTAVSDAVYQMVSQRMAIDQTFFLYVDQDAGANHGFASGRFGANPRSLETVHVDTGCIDDPSAASGCSIDANALDRTRGTVLRVSFDAQSPSNFAGLNIEEPEHWGVRQTGVGYDLRGATSVVVDVRSPDHATVRFGVGGCSTGPMTIPAAWQTLTIPLSALDCTPDLSDVHLLFAVATSDSLAPSGATVLLDNIRFNPVPTSRSFQPVAFPVANQTFGVVPRQAAPIPPDQVLRNVTTVYESALAALAFFTRGRGQDFINAGQIVDAFHAALIGENSGDPLPMAPDGSVGLHNAYESGDLSLMNAQEPPKQGQAGESRLAGFTATSLCPGSGVCLVLDGATGGNNAFAMLSLIAAFQRFGDTRYLNDAVTIGRWIVGNLMDVSGQGYDGYYLGYPDQGVPPPKPLQTGKSTENNADIYAAFTAMANLATELGDAGAAAGWTAVANVAGDFVMQMFEATKGRFNAGTVPAGTAAGAGICPDGPQHGIDVTNTCDFLDAQTLTTLAMAGAGRYRNQIDWRQPVQYVRDHFAQTISVGGQTFQGFDLVPAPVSGANGVAWEFTAQAIEAMRYVDRLYGVTTFEASRNFYLAQMAHAQADAPFGDGLGLVASTLQNGDTLPPVQQCLQTPFQCIAERVGLAASIWAAFAEQQLNVLLFTASTPAIRVTSPNTPVSWAVGTPRTVTWTHNLGVYGLVTLELSRDGGASWEIIASSIQNAAATTGFFVWTVTGPPAASALIRVTGDAAPASDASDVPFAIVSPDVTVTSPNGSGNLQIASTKNITFTHNLGVGQAVNLDVSRDGGATWTPIAVVTTTSPTSGTYPWLVSGPVTTHARIRAQWASNPSARGVSDLDFSITGPSVTVTSPNGTGSLRIGNTQNIYFTHNLGIGQPVNLDVSRDGGTTWSPVGVMTTTSVSSGTFPWVVNGPPTSQALIRASWAANPTVFDRSDSNFVIIDRITVTAPNTPVIWTAGALRTITWAHNLGASATVDIAVSRDGGETWSPVAAGVPNGAATTGSYAWVVKGPATSHARIRVSVAGSPVNDVSDTDFAIVNPVVTVISPNGAGIVQIGNTQQIIFTHTLGVGQPVNLDVSRDGGVTWSSIPDVRTSATLTTTSAASGTYSWVVSGPPTTQARIRASWATDPTVFDISDVNYTISARPADH